MANKAFKYRIYPTKKQQRILTEWLALCCQVYNAALDERKSAYRMAGISLSYTHQCAELPGCKEVRPELAQVNSQVLQEVVKRVDLAFDAFFQRVKEGKKPGYPRSSTGKWYVSISCAEVEPNVLPPSDKVVGADVGLKTFAYLSDGTTIENPRFFRAEEKQLAKAQRKLSKAQQGSRQRKKQRKVVARVHERIRQRRENFVQQETRKLINTYGFIALEALTVHSLLKHPNLAKSIADASWSMFVRMLLAKAAEAEREVVRVHPAYTTQTCSCCGHRQALPLAVRVYECPACGLVIDRDYNSSKNILDEAFKAVGRHSRVIPEAPAL